MTLTPPLPLPVSICKQPLGEPLSYANLARPHQNMWYRENTVEFGKLVEINVLCFGCKYCQLNGAYIKCSINWSPYLYFTRSNWHCWSSCECFEGSELHVALSQSDSDSICRVRHGFLTWSTRHILQSVINNYFWLWYTWFKRHLTLKGQLKMYCFGDKNK